MNEKILFVDDDINILQAYKRQLRKQFDLYTAQGPEEGLKLIAGRHTFAVVVSDFSMPGMNGVEFLSEVKQVSPNSVRIMLTGFANATNAINAVNEGNIFRFLAKPCSPEQLALSLHSAIDQYHLITAEKELLEKTLFGSIKVMSQILSLVNPVAFSSTSRIKSYIKHMVETLGLPGKWRYELAGCCASLVMSPYPLKPHLRFSRISACRTTSRSYLMRIRLFPHPCWIIYPGLRSSLKWCADNSLISVIINLQRKLFWPMHPHLAVSCSK